MIDDTLYDALGQRQVTQYFTQVNTYQLIMEVVPEQQGDLAVLDKLFVKSATGQAVPLSTFVKIDTSKTAPLSISHQSQFPAVTISFNLAPGVALGARGGRHQDGDARPRIRRSRCRARSRAPRRRSSPRCPASPT